ncbi:hypothetical protein AALP_AAs50312U000100 [Arabis alpina]|uniref:Uncharacterized protein n=1 Tax=Arabis alpina TaxID=50452 RepID=A0A087G0F8_ARAAL|nr:hypothetical protein AALP_AAs50312U000100 [Arabis alpina]
MIRALEIQDRKLPEISLKSPVRNQAVSLVELMSQSRSFKTVASGFFVSERNKISGVGELSFEEVRDEEVRDELRLLLGLVFLLASHYPGKVAVGGAVPLVDATFEPIIR